MWFEKLTGFQEEPPKKVRGNMSIDGGLLKSHINGKEYVCGFLETPSLAELRDRVNRCEHRLGKLSVREIVADAQKLHIDISNAGSLFQVASQFNLLEMTSPFVTPEHGVSCYEYDQTQGPACAIAAGAGTIYRNYFVNINGKPGQTTENQIDCLADISSKLGNSDNCLWEMKNGYALASEAGLIEINNRIMSANDSEIDEIRKLLRIGIQWHTEVTLSESKHLISQALCSALPIAYSKHSSNLWEKFAQIILEASYESTLCAGILNSIKNNNNKIYLTLVGAGAFGNELTWVINAMKRSFELYRHIDLDIIIVSHKHSNKNTQELINLFN